MTPVALSLKLAALTTLLLLVAATPVALWLARGDGWARRIVQAAVALPLVLPPTVLGFYLLVALGPTTALGRAITSLLGHTLAFSFAGLLFGSLLYNLPFAVQPLVSGFTAVDRELEETAAALGASPWRVFREITLPLSKSAFLTAATLTFAHTLGEFGIVLMLGGDIPGSTQTVSIALYDRVQEANYAAANHIAALLVAVSFAALLILYWKVPTRILRRSDLG